MGLAHLNSGLGRLQTDHATRESNQDRGAVLHCVPTGSASRRLAITDMWDRDHSPSLSSDYKEENVGRSVLFPIMFSPMPRWVPPSTHHQLATVWLPHLAIPPA
jgi:hypothetical protein